MGERGMSAEYERLREWGEVYRPAWVDREAAKDRRIAELEAEVASANATAHENAEKRDNWKREWLATCDELDAARADMASLAVSAEAAEVLMAALGKTLERATRERDILLGYAIRKFGYTAEYGWTEEEASKQIRGDLGLDAASAEKGGA